MGLLEKYLNYESICGYTVRYELETGNMVEFSLQRRNFPHLIGLHKLKDIDIIRRFNNPNDKVVNSGYIISWIKSGKITEEEIINSCEFDSIKERYNCFSDDIIQTLIYTDIIVDFNSEVVNSILKAKCMLFYNNDDLYYHLSIGQDDKGEYYAESFFIREDNAYIRKQKTIKVRQITIIDKTGDIYFQESFS
ncbi:MAG: PBECR4 domain-containing protein [Clostridia bacterium]|nr:PBECR4 domain-containing protein [Clostridia bacterium]